MAQSIIWGKTGDSLVACETGQNTIVNFTFHLPPDQPAPNWPANIMQVRYGLGRFGLRSRGRDLDANGQPVTKVLSYRGIRQQIDIDRPFIAGWTWDRGGGHMVLVRGYEYETGGYHDVLFMNPGDGGGHKASYAWFLRGNDTHTWTNTIWDIHD